MELPKDDIILRIQRVGHMVALDSGLLFDGERLRVEVIERAGQILISGILGLAVQDEMVYDEPEDWWQWVKQRWMPMWMRKRWPVRMKRLWLMHKYPEVNISQEMLGKEFVHLHFLSPDYNRWAESIQAARSWREGLNL